MYIADASMFAKFTDEETFSKLKLFDSVKDMWLSAKEYGDAVALKDHEAELTYSELDARINEFKGVLLARGLKKGDRAGILYRNSPEFVKAFFALASLGITAAVFPPQLDAMTVFGVSYKFGLKALITGEEYEEKLSVLKLKMPAFAIIDVNEKAEPVAECADVKGGDECVIMFTGGTTGRSKGALLTHANIAAGALYGCYGVRDVFFQKYILCLPFSHVFGLVRNLMTSIYTGSTLCFCNNNKDLFKDVGYYNPTVLVTVPALAEMALGLSGMFKRNMLGTVKTIICGAAFVPPYLIREFKKLGIDLYPGYGLTESANLVSGNPMPLEKPSSVGLPYPWQELKTENGELLLKGVNIMKEYVGDPEETRNAFTEDGWFKTGDLVRFDEDGFLYIVGRIKEVIILSNGLNVSPQEVEALYNESPYVRDCQLFEDADGDGPHFLHLEVVARESELAKVPEDVRENTLLGEISKVTESLPSYQRPARVTVRKEDFERTPAMKIKRYNKFAKDNNQ
ncbi:MAG: acyl--CoA ligase [Clostridia bacterium]|nr:acyl--CoA ligase [Clostridia bacterium]